MKIHREFESFNYLAWQKISWGKKKNNAKPFKIYQFLTFFHVILDSSLKRHHSLMATNDRSDYFCCCCCSAQRNMYKKKFFKTLPMKKTIIQYQAWEKKCFEALLEEQGSHPKTSLPGVWRGRLVGHSLEFFDHEISWLKLFPPDLSRWRSSLRKTPQCIISCTL